MEQQDILSSNQSQQSLPNATATLVLGILSLMFCFIYGLPGLILGIIGLVLGNKDKKIYQANPGGYSKNSYSNSNAGRVCSLIGVILSSIYVAIIAIVLIFIGTNTEILDLFKGGLKG